MPSKTIPHTEERPKGARLEIGMAPMQPISADSGLTEQLPSRLLGEGQAPQSEEAGENWSMRRSGGRFVSRLGRCRFSAGAKAGRYPAGMAPRQPREYVSSSQKYLKFSDQAIWLSLS